MRTQLEVARILGVSKGRVSQLERRAIRKIRRSLGIKLTEDLQLEAFINDAGGIVTPVQRSLQVEP